jgi:hypothetical protein
MRRNIKKSIIKSPSRLLSKNENKKELSSIKSKIKKKGCDPITKEVNNNLKSLLEYYIKCEPNNEIVIKNNLINRFRYLKTKIKKSNLYFNNPTINNLIISKNINVTKEVVSQLEDFIKTNDTISLKEVKTNKSSPGMKDEIELSNLIESLGKLTTSDLELIKNNLLSDLILIYIQIFENIISNKEVFYGRQTTINEIKELYKNNPDNFKRLYKIIQNLNQFGFFYKTDENLLVLLKYIEDGKKDDNFTPNNLLKPFAYSFNFLINDFSKNNWSITEVNLVGEKALLTDITINGKNAPKTKKPDIKIIIKDDKNINNIQTLGISYKKDNAWTIQSHFSKLTWENILDKKNNEFKLFLQDCSSFITNIINNNININDDLNTNNFEKVSDEEKSIWINSTIVLSTIDGNKNHIGQKSYRSNKLLFGFGSHLTNSLKNDSILDIDTIWCSKFGYTTDHYKIYMDSETHLIFQLSPKRWLSKQQKINSWSDFFKNIDKKKYKTESVNSSQYDYDQKGNQILSWRNNLSIDCNEKQNKIWLKILINNLNSDTLSDTNFKESYIIWYDILNMKNFYTTMILSLEDLILSTDGVWTTYDNFINVNNEKDESVNATKLIKKYKQISQNTLIFPHEDLKNLKYISIKSKTNKIISPVLYKTIEDNISSLLVYLKSISDENLNSIQSENDKNLFKLSHLWVNKLGFSNIQDYTEYSKNDDKNLLLTTFLKTL